MVDNNEDTGPTEVAIVKPSISEQNDLIENLMQQIVELTFELQIKQYFSISIVDISTLADGRLPLHFFSSEINSEHVLNNPPSNLTKNPSTINLTTSNLNQTNNSYQPPSPLQSFNSNPQYFTPLENLNADNSQMFPPFQSLNVNILQTSLKIHATLNPTSKSNF